MGIINPHKGDRYAQSILEEARTVCLLGAGGVGMYSIGRQLLERGYFVIGADRANNAFTFDLEKRGALFFASEAPPLASLESSDVLVYSAALNADHPAILFAQKMRKPLLSRADALAFLMIGARPRVAVCGAHGKSTTTAMCAHMLAHVGEGCTMVCGAETENDGTCYKSGKGAYVFEACEYMHSFLSFSPEIAIVTNIDHDHADCYPTLKSIKGAFYSFLKQSKTAVLNADCAHSRQMQGASLQSYFFSLKNPKADAYLDEQNRLYWQGEYYTDLPLCLPGECNRANATAAALGAILCGASGEAIKEAARVERGVKRRLAYKGMCGGVRFYDDYAHHPTEINAAISAIRPFCQGRLICVFQSHTYTRTAACLSEIALALQKADLAVIADVYPARETDTLGMSASVIAKEIGENAVPVSGYKEIATYLLTTCRKQDTVLVMGAGDIFRIFDHLTLL